MSQSFEQLTQLRCINLAVPLGIQDCECPLEVCRLCLPGVSLLRFKPSSQHIESERPCGPDDVDCDAPEPLHLPFRWECDRCAGTAIDVRATLLVLRGNNLTLQRAYRDSCCGCVTTAAHPEIAHWLMVHASTGGSVHHAMRSFASRCRSCIRISVYLHKSCHKDRGVCA